MPLQIGQRALGSSFIGIFVPILSERGYGELGCIQGAFALAGHHLFRPVHLTVSPSPFRLN